MTVTSNPNPISVLESLFSIPLRTGVPRQDIAYIPAANVARKADDFVITVDLPGVNGNEVLIELDDQAITISGSRTGENSGKGLNEIAYGTFSRSFPLPNDVSESAIEARHDNGVLTVVVGGVFAKVEPKKIKVQVN